MKKIYLILILLPLNVFGQSTTDLQKRLSEIEARLDDMQLQQAVNRLSFSGSFLNQYENLFVVRKKNDTPTSIEEDDEDVNLSVYFMRVALNFDVYISKKFSFYSTLGMSKYWNMDGRNTRVGDESENFQSLSGGYSSEGSAAHFDVAYLSFNPNEKWNFAIGRMTTNNGPPLNQLDGLSRSGTYPMMTYNVIFDGAAAVYNFSHLVPKPHKLKMRFFYTPFLNIDLNSKSKNRADTVYDGSGDVTDDRGDRIKSHANFMTLLTEYSYSGLSWLKKLDLYHAYFTVDGVYYGGRQNPQKSGIEYEGAVANIFYFGFNQIAGTGLSLSYTFSEYLFRSALVEEKTSSNHYYSINYKFDNSFNGGHILGGEFIKNDENKLPTDWTTMQVTPFYNLYNGEGYHLFYTIPYGTSHIFRIGAYKYNTNGSSYLQNDVTDDGNAAYARWKVFF